MPNATFHFVNGTATNLTQSSVLPAGGWVAMPPHMLDAHAVPPNAVFPRTDTNLTITYGQAGRSYNAQYLAGHPATVHVTNGNMNGTLQTAANGDVTVTLTYL